MAGDWIKMRTDLYRDPKVILIADILMDQEGPLASAISQECQRNMTVTRRVMRCVTVGALVSVWGIARHRGDRIENDLRLNNCCSAVVDDMAEVPGLGDAMMAAGWLTEDEAGVVFPRFFDQYNEEPERRPAAKTNAQRQREYRARKRGSNESNETLQQVTVEKRREEKRREEKKTPLNPPKGKSRRLSATNNYSDAFEAFWRAFPKGRRTNKPKAWEAYQAAIPVVMGPNDSAEDAEAYLEARAEEYAASWLGQSEFVSGPVPWLNQQKWEDAPEAWQRRKTSNGQQSSYEITQLSES